MFPSTNNVAKTFVNIFDQGTFTPVGAQGGFHGTPPPP